MKIWIKLICGIILGIIINIFLPLNEGLAGFFSDLSGLFIQIGKYALFPLIFFSLIIGTYELKIDKKIISVYSKSILLIIATCIILVLIGFVTAILFSEKIPLFTSDVSTPVIPDFLESLNNMFPDNIFKVLVYNGNIMLPLFIFAFIIGTNLTFDRVLTRPIIQLSDSLSRVFYHIITLIIELFWIACIVLTISNLFKLSSVTNISTYGNLLLIIAIDFIVIIFGLLPLLIYLYDRKNNPYKILYGSIASALTGFISGDIFLSLGMLIIHGKDNFKLPRKLGSTIYPLFAMFSRAGTALVSSISFFIILRSVLPPTEIDIFKMLFVFGFSFLFSFTLGSVPALGTFVSITLLNYQFDQFWPTYGILNHMKILEPVMFILISLGVFLDIIVAYVLSYIIGKSENLVKLNEIRYFI
jgi:aerobic C4-dicarboxylate transport protein